MVGKIYNFAAGPAQLPAPVLKKAQAELMNWHSSGMSVMEMSHRGSLFQEIHAGAKEKLRSLLSVPSSHDILFMQSCGACFRSRARTTSCSCRAGRRASFPRSR